MTSFLPCFIALLLSITSLSAQQLEMRAVLSSGLSAYRGGGAVDVSRINGGTYTNNPYGSKNGIGYGLAVNIRKITKGSFIFGAELGAEVLRSKVDLKYSDVVWGDILSGFEGRTFLNNTFLNVFPFIGGRLRIVDRQFDLLGGLDLGYLLRSREKGKAISDVSGEEVTTSSNRRNIKTDLRPRIQVSTDFGKVGLYIGYSHGLRNYRAGLIGMAQPSEAYARVARFGLTYLL